MAPEASRPVAVRAVAAIALCLASGCAPLTAAHEGSEEMARWREWHRMSEQAARAPIAAAFTTLLEANGLDPRLFYLTTPRDSLVGRQAEAIGGGLNAASLGEHVFVVTDELWRFGGDRCVLLGIAAHELAHDFLGHAQRRRTANTVAQVAALLPYYVGVVLGGVSAVALPIYSRSQERDADAATVKILERAGEPPWAQRYALEYLTRRYGDTGGGWFQGHPASADRIAALPPVGDTRVCVPPVPGPAGTLLGEAGLPVAGGDADAMRRRLERYTRPRSETRAPGGAGSSLP